MATQQIPSLMTPKRSFRRRSRTLYQKKLSQRKLLAKKLAKMQNLSLVPQRNLPETVLCPFVQILPFSQTLDFNDVGR